VEGAQGRRILEAERIATPRDDALVQRPRFLGSVEVGEGDRQTVSGGECVQVARPEDALTTLQQDGVLVAGDRVFVHLQADRRHARFGFQRGRMLGPEELAPRIHDLPADRALDLQVRDATNQDVQVL
jgi:hypothetical protein